MRVLVTGSQYFTDLAGIAAALSFVWQPDAVLVTGACPKGAEQTAARCWASWGGQVERWEFDWDQPWGDVVAGRNRAMLEAGADVCLGFDSMSGTEGSDDGGGAGQGARVRVAARAWARTPFLTESILRRGSGRPEQSVDL
jgi:hypothetical protein